MPERSDFEVRLSVAMKLFAAAADGPVDARAIAGGALETAGREGLWQRVVAAANRGPMPAISRVVTASAGVAVVVIAAALMAMYFGRPDPPVVPPGSTEQPTRSPSPVPVSGTMPAEQIAVIARQVDALNSRDAEAFLDVFPVDGAFNARGTFAAASSLFASTLPVADRHLADAWMAINEAWLFEAELVTCDRLSRSEYVRRYGLYEESSDIFGHCAMTSRWHRLSLEVGEWWHYEFDEATIVFWGQTVREPSPLDRSLPLGLDGLLDWETWLEAADPDAAARLLNPRIFPVTIPCSDDSSTYVGEGHTASPSPEPACEWSASQVDAAKIAADGYGRGQADWVIGGQRFWPAALIPYDPVLAEQIEASIADFLRSVGSGR